MPPRQCWIGVSEIRLPKEARSVGEKGGLSGLIPTGNSCSSKTKNGDKTRGVYMVSVLNVNIKKKNVNQ